MAASRVIEQVVVEDNFFSDALALRKEFEGRFDETKDPADPRRFVWEYWHIPEQFSQHRALAKTIFSNGLWQSFEKRLLQWAQQTLGLSELGGPPWISFLLDGDFQALHRDSPNGQFAFSYSLSKTPLPFRGGRTWIARNDLLDYWCTESFEDAHRPLHDEYEPIFNRITSFDSRIPHAVTRCEGPKMAVDGRVAIQGWLRAKGVISPGDSGVAQSRLNERFATNKTIVANAKGVDGLLTVKVGSIEKKSRTNVRATVLVDTLRSTDGDSKRVALVKSAILREIESVFEAEKHSGVVPVVIKRGRGVIAE